VNGPARESIDEVERSAVARSRTKGKTDFERLREIAPSSVMWNTRPVWLMMCPPRLYKSPKGFKC